MRIKIGDPTIYFDGAMSGEELVKIKTYLRRMVRQNIEVELPRGLALLCQMFLNDPTKPNADGADTPAQETAGD